MSAPCTCWLQGIDDCDCLEQENRFNDVQRFNSTFRQLTGLGDLMPVPVPPIPYYGRMDPAFHAHRVLAKLAEFEEVDAHSFFTDEPGLQILEYVNKILIDALQDDLNGDEYLDLSIEWSEFNWHSDSEFNTDTHLSQDTLLRWAESLIRRVADRMTPDMTHYAVVIGASRLISAL